MRVEHQLHVTAGQGDRGRRVALTPDLDEAEIAVQSERRAQEFGARTYDDVTVGELASAADVTTGALYHHFDSTFGLYEFVRQDVEQRLLDRMEGAIAASRPGADRSAAVLTALLVGFDFAVEGGFLRILSVPPAGATHDRVAELLGAGTASATPLLGRMLTAAWRAALSAVAEGTDPETARAALLAFEFRIAP